VFTRARRRVSGTRLALLAPIAAGFFAGAAILSLIAQCTATADDDVSRAGRSPIVGTFIQYQSWMMKLDERAWRLELEAMRRAGIRIVIIQWLQMDDSRFIPGNDTAVDPTRVILEYADQHGMKVFVGLAHADLWWTRLREPRYLIRAGRASIRVANEAWARYGRYRSFAGWYFPQELRDANYPPQQIEALRNFWKGLGNHCRALSGGKPVSISPAMSGLIPPGVFQRVYTSLLLGSGIDVLIFQDGVGARGWDDEIEQRVVPYFRAMRDACRAAGVEMWSDIEIFHRPGKTGASVPASLNRIERQLAAEAPYVKSFVMFDFFHYMSPYRGTAQKKLYEDYLRELAPAGEVSR